MMKKIIFGLIVVVCLWSTGCQTLTRDSDQEIRNYSLVADLNRRMLTEDVDSMLLLDKPSSLNKWHVPAE
jgi:hypothetical protein